jgi:hypothetical protein
MKPEASKPVDSTHVTPDSPKSVLTKSQGELVAYLFDAQRSALTAPLTAWIAASPRYAAFVEKYKAKIRKKLRVTREAGAADDLLYELQIPYWLLQDPRFEVAYEAYSAGQTRGPDYSVTFRTNFTFNIEVTHTRGLQRTPAAPAGGAVIDYRLIDVLCGKLPQMLANMANLLFVVSASAGREPLDLPAHIAWIKDKAERSDPLFYARQRFLNASDFFKQFARLSGLVLYDPTSARQAALWLNPQAKAKLPDPVKTILQRGLA